MSIRHGERHDGDGRTYRAIRHIQGKPVTNFPGLLSMDSNSAGTLTQRFIWFDSSGNLRIHNALPTDPDAEGTTLGIGAGANTALSNIASVSIPDAGDLLPTNANQVDIGSAAKYMKDIFMGGDFYHQTATFDTKLSFTTPAADSVYTVPDAGTAGEFMINTGAANAISLAKGTASIVLAAAADLDVAAAGNVDFGTGTYNFVGNIDVATGKTVNIDNDMTIQGDLTVSATCVINQSLATTADPTFAALTVTSVTDGTATLTAGALSGITTIGTTDSITIAADSKYLYLGASSPNDGKIYYTAANDLTFYDPNTGVVKLVDMAGGSLTNPDVVGDLSIADGKITWTDLVDEVAGIFTFSGITNDGIDVIANVATTGNIIHAASTSLTSGTVFRADTAEATLNAGYYFEAYDTSGAATVWCVGEDGKQSIIGASGSDMFVLTAGDIQITDGDIDMDKGKITIDTADDEASYITRTKNAATTAAVFTITTASVGDTKPGLVVAHAATGAIDAQQITHDGTGYGLSVIGAATTGKQALFRGPASQTTSSVVVDGTTGSWIGASGVGMLHLSSDGALAHAGSSLLYSTYTGAIGAVTSAGTCGQFIDAGAAGAGVAYAVSINSTNNNGLNIITGAVGKTNLLAYGVAGQTANMVYLDGTTGTGWVGATGTAILAIASDGTLAHANASMLNISHSGAPANSALGSSLRIVDSGAAAGAKPAYVAYINTTNNDGLAIVTGLVSSQNLVLSGIQAQTAAIVTIDGTTGTGWTGAAGIGMLDISGDATTAATTASLVNIKSGAGTPAIGSLGYALRIADTTAASGTSYAFYISAANNEAINVAAGKVLIAETLTASAGIITKHSDALLVDAAVPTAAELAAAFAFTTEGQIGTLDHNNAHTNVYVAVYDGVNYWYEALTKAV